MKNIPQKIYLLLGLGNSNIESDDYDFNKIENIEPISWSKKRENSSDIEYSAVKNDITTSNITENDKEFKMTDKEKHNQKLLQDHENAFMDVVSTAANNAANPHYDGSIESVSDDMLNDYKMSLLRLLNGWQK